MADLVLDKPEIRVLTGHAHLKDQIAWLERYRVPYRLDGKRLLVSRTAAEKWLGGQDIIAPREPDLSGVT